MKCPVIADLLAMHDDLGIKWKETDVTHFLKKNHENRETVRIESFMTKTQTGDVPNMIQKCNHCSMIFGFIFICFALICIRSFRQEAILYLLISSL